MQLPIILYLASVLGAVGLLLVMPKRSLNLWPVGAVLGAAALGGLWLFIRRQGLLPEVTGLPEGAFPFYYIFSAIAIVAGVRVVTHTRPVYAALWFVLVILASAGQFLVLAADFIALAVIIIYGGAILVTYMFVIMLATQASGDTESGDDQPLYERYAREPLAAVAAGFFLLAVLLGQFFEPIDRYTDARMRPDAEVIADTLGARSTQHPALEPILQATESAPHLRLSNTEQVGLDLFQGHPLGIELAGVVLLVALIGAVVIAKRQLGDESSPQNAPPDATGATARPTREPGPLEAESQAQYAAPPPGRS